MLVEPNNRGLCLFSLSELLLGLPIIDFLLFLRKALKMLTLQGSKTLSWDVHTVLSHFDGFSNPPHPPGLLRLPVFFWDQRVVTCSI